jgi:hypothetical protein
VAQNVAAQKVAAQNVAAQKVAAQNVAAQKVVAQKVVAQKVAAQKVVAQKVAAQKVVTQKTSFSIFMVNVQKLYLQKLFRLGAPKKKNQKKKTKKTPQDTAYVFTRLSTNKTEANVLSLIP